MRPFLRMKKAVLYVIGFVFALRVAAIYGGQVRHLHRLEPAKRKEITAKCEKYFRWTKSPIWKEGIAYSLSKIYEGIGDHKNAGRMRAEKKYWHEVASNEQAPRR